MRQRTSAQPSLDLCLWTFAGDSTVHKQLAEADLIVELMNVIVSIAMFEADVMVILKWAVIHKLFACEIQTGRQKDIQVEMAGLHIPPPPTQQKKLTILPAQ